MLKEPVKIAVMGTGSFGTLHAKTLNAFPEARLVALGNRTRSKAEALAKDLGVSEVFSRIDELIDRKIAEALVIATNTETHVAIAEAALAAGMHVLIEKPVAEDLAGIHRLEALCSKASRVAMAGHICIFHSLIAPLIDRVRQQGFRSAHFVRHRPARLVQLFPDDHPITLTMVHDLYVAAQMVRGVEPSLFDAFETKGSDGKTDQTWATLRWSDGRVVTFHSHWILPEGSPGDGFDWVEIFGQGYHTRVSTNPQNWSWTEDKVTRPIALEMSNINARPTGMLAEELRSFLAACRGAAVPDGCRLSDAIQVQRWMDQLLHICRIESSLNA
jgi:predicted dehydrogenase